jgi:hypothetical protein
MSRRTGLIKSSRESIHEHANESVIQGKVEDIPLDDKVDVIISEWMVSQRTVLADDRGTCYCMNRCSTLFFSEFTCLSEPTE